MTGAGWGLEGSTGGGFENEWDLVIFRKWWQWVVQVGA